MPEALFINSPYFLPAVAVGLVFAFFYFFKSGKFGKKEESYKPSEDFQTTVNKDLKENMNLHGQGFGFFSPAKLFIGMQKIGLIDKFYYGKGKFASYYFDDDKKDYIVEEESKDESHELCFIRLKSSSIIHQILGLGKKYVIIKAKDDKDVEMLHFEPQKRIMQLPRDTHLRLWGNVWHNCKEGAEFINDISIRRLAEVTMTHVQCFPDKVVLFNEDQLKKERLGRIYSEIESKKWEKRKDAEDTVIQ